jgi:small subunit ribosomal protein S20
MPNNKSAERRMRNSARKQIHNRGISTRLHSMERKFQESFKAGKKDDAAAALKLAISAWDKAAKTGTVPRSRANRKKSRLSLQLGRLK